MLRLFEAEAHGRPTTNYKPTGDAQIDDDIAPGLDENPIYNTTTETRLIVCEPKYDETVTRGGCDARTTTTHIGESNVVVVMRCDDPHKEHTVDVCKQSPQTQNQDIFGSHQIIKRIGTRQPDKQPAS